MNARTAWPAPAKLNLFLHVVGRRDDGYHLLQTAFRLLDWCDEVSLRVRDDGVIRREQGLPGITDDDDLGVRAARALQRASGTILGADIAIDKQIPAGAGLGGGSSDAATVLVALNELWGLGWQKQRLAALGTSLGADVPVFVHGANAWAEGAGERLTPLSLPPRWYVVVDPGIHVSTAELFQAPELTRNAPATTITGLLAGEVIDNAFEPVARARHPRVTAALDWLGEFGGARLSGSGGAVFLELESRDRAESIAARCPAGFVARAVRGAEVSPLEQALLDYRRGKV